MTNGPAEADRSGEAPPIHGRVRRRDNRLITVLCVQAAINAAASSQSLVEIAPPRVASTVALLNAMLSSATAAYVASTRPTSWGKRHRED